MSRFVAFRDSTGIEPNLVPPIVVYSMSHKIKIKNLLTEDMFFFTTLCNNKSNSC